jgi:recombinational DNA repair protein (RecF pathway)
VAVLAAMKTAGFGFEFKVCCRSGSFFFFKPSELPQTEARTIHKIKKNNRQNEKE